MTFGIRFACLSAVFGILLGGSSACWGHGTGYRLLENTADVALEFRYSSGEPMAYAEVLIWHPEDTKIEYQNGRTDRLGRFAFLPNAPGNWKVVVKDGMGHQVTAICPVDTASPAGPSPESRATGAPPPRVPGALLGLSLLANMTFCIAIVCRFRKLRTRKA
jgi:nickel transport protein